MASVDEQYEATFRAAVEAAVREYQNHGGKTSRYPALAEAITAAARSWVDEKASDRYHEGKSDGWYDGAQAERDSHTCERE